MDRSVLSCLLRLDRCRRRELKRALAPYQYVGVMHLIVLYISRHPGASQEEITGFYALDKTSVARDARRLEDLGHIRRCTAPDNRRQYQLFLTEAGQAMTGVIDEATRRFQQSLSAGIPPEDWQQLAVLLQQLVNNICPVPPGGEGPQAGGGAGRAAREKKPPEGLTGSPLQKVQ